MMRLFGYLVIFLCTVGIMDAVAPNDYDSICRTNFLYRVAHDWIPYANDTSSGTWKVLIDQYDYQNILGFGGVWSALDANNDGRSFVRGSGGTCTYQIQARTYFGSNQDNWVFTQAVDYLDAVELIVNATVRFSQCIQRRVANPPCINDFVILHRYDTNTLSETERVKPTNYQPYNGTSENSRLRQDQVNTDTDTIIIERFRRPANINYTYLGIQDIGTQGSVVRIFIYYEVCPGRVEGIVTYPEVPHPGTLPRAPSRITRLARCAEHAHNTTSLETYAYQNGSCIQSVTCVCDAGYEENGLQCVACTPGKYRSASNSSCVDCPANSNSLSAAAESCSCNEGYYRAMASEGIGLSCTAPPPPLSDCWVSATYDHAVTVQWRNPPNCGGRDDCYYQIRVNNDPPIRYNPNTVFFSTYTVEDLQPDTIYAIRVSIHNGVSEQDADNASLRLRECTITATTIRGSVFVLGGITYPNNTAVILEHIGEENKNSLLCTSAYTLCCRTNKQGRLYYPNGEPVLPLSQASRQSLYLTHNNGSISLKRQPGETLPPLGKYRCEIPDARGTLQNLFITIGTTQEPTGVVSCPECPTVSDCPTQQSPLTSPSDITPESVTDVHLGRYRCEIPGTLQNVYITISETIEEPEQPTAQSQDCPTKQLPVTSPIEATPETIPDIHFELNGVILTNNSAVDLNDIGEGDRALLCKTNLPNCCRTLPNRFGEFFYPSGLQVPIRASDEGFYRDRGEQRIRLNRREEVTSPTGRFRCAIPDANRVMRNVYITIN